MVRGENQLIRHVKISFSAVRTMTDGEGGVRTVVTMHCVKSREKHASGGEDCENNAHNKYGTRCNFFRAQAHTKCISLSCAELQRCWRCSTALTRPIRLIPVAALGYAMIQPISTGADAEALIPVRQTLLTPYRVRYINVLDGSHYLSIVNCRC